MVQYVICDEETGSFVSSDSVMKIGNEIWYSTHTGKDFGLEYHNTFEGAEKKLHKVKKTLEKYKIHKNFKVIEVNKETMLKGEFIKIRLN